MKEKFDEEQKKALGNLDVQGKKLQYLSKVLGVSPSTIYKGKKEGKLLNKIAELEFQNRSLIVQYEILKISQNSLKKSGRSL